MPIAPVDAREHVVGVDAQRAAAAARDGALVDGAAGPVSALRVAAVGDDDLRMPTAGRRAAPQVDGRGAQPVDR